MYNDLLLAKQNPKRIKKTFTYLHSYLEKILLEGGVKLVCWGIVGAVQHMELLPPFHLDSLET